MVPDATERKVLAICAFVAGLLLLAPGERVSAIVALTLAAAIGVAHLLLSRRERRSAVSTAPSAPTVAPPAEVEAPPSPASSPASDA